MCKSEVTSPGQFIFGTKQICLCKTIFTPLNKCASVKNLFKTDCIDAIFRTRLLYALISMINLYQPQSLKIIQDQLKSTKINHDTLTSTNTYQNEAKAISDKLYKLNLKVQLYNSVMLWLIHSYKGQSKLSYGHTINIITKSKVIKGHSRSSKFFNGLQNFWSICIPIFLHSYIPIFLHSYIPTFLYYYIHTFLQSYIPKLLHS